MTKVHTETFELRAGSCDLFSAWTPSAILSCMQETAGAHSALLGLDRERMLSGNLGWILSRLKVEFTRLPKAGEKLTVETWPTPNRHLFFPRSHVFRDESGAQIGCANSLWATMNLTDRRVEKSDFVIQSMPDNRDLDPAAGMPATVRPLGGEVTGGSVVSQFTDLDTNGHVNNARYMDWCMNALGTELLRSRCVTAFDVNYDSEILPDSAVRTELSVEGDRFTFIGFGSDGKKHFSIGGTLSPRE